MPVQRSSPQATMHLAARRIRYKRSARQHPPLPHCREQPSCDERRQHNRRRLRLRRRTGAFCVRPRHNRRRLRFAGELGLFVFGRGISRCRLSGGILAKAGIRWQRDVCPVIGRLRLVTIGMARLRGVRVCAGRLGSTGMVFAGVCSTSTRARAACGPRTAHNAARHKNENESVHESLS